MVDVLVVIVLVTREYLCLINAESKHFNPTTIVTAKTKNNNVKKLMDRHEATSYIFRVLSASCPWHPTSLKGLRQQEGWGNRSHQKLPEKFRAFRDKMATS